MTASADIAGGVGWGGLPPCVRSARRVLFVGGSFDPVHNGHIRPAFDAASAWFGRGGEGHDVWVVFVPAARSPHKDTPPIEDRHRVEMLRIALRGRSRWWIWDEELARAGRNPGEPSYWADTWSLAARCVPHAERAFLVGTDQALAMHRWSRFGSFWRDAVVVRRGDEPIDDFLGSMRATGAWDDAALAHWASRVVDGALIDASSSAIRSALADPANRNAPIEGLDRGVQGYIVERGLYGPA